jgi:hypothetical protein
VHALGLWLLAAMLVTAGEPAPEPDGSVSVWHVEKLLKKR